MVKPVGDEDGLRGLRCVSIAPLGVLSIRRIDRGTTRTPDELPEVAAGQFGAVAFDGQLRAVSLAPGEWIVLGPPARLSAIAERNRRGFLCADLSDGRLVLFLDAKLAEEALSALCPLDLTRDLAPGRAAASLFGEIDATFFSESDGHILMIADRSYGAYLCQLLGSVRED